MKLHYVCFAESVRSMTETEKEVYFEKAGSKEMAHALLENEVGAVTTPILCS